MTVSLSVKSIDIERNVPKPGLANGDIANVHIVISGLGPPIETTLRIFEFSSFDDAADRARRASFEFAGELANAADHKPLR
jgi:hypothetical protein